MNSGAAPSTAGTRTHRRSLSLLLDQMRHSTIELWRSRMVLVFTFLFPLTWLVVLGFMIGNATVDDGSGVRMMQFVTPTAAVLGVLYATFPSVASSLADAREQGVLKRVRGTPLPTWMYASGRIVGAAGFAFASLLVMLGFGVVVYDVQIIGRTALATAVTTGVAIICFATTGLAVATVARTAAVAQAASIGAATALAFVSGVLAIGDLPVWADRFAAVFPLKHFNDAVQNQFDPFGSGAGWDVPALAAMGAWTVAAAIVAVRSFSWEPAPAKRGRTIRASGEHTPSRTRPTLAVAEPGPATAVRLLRAEVGWATRGTLRDPGWVFFAIAMPIGLYAFIAAVTSGTGPTGEGVPHNLDLASGMVAWGAAVTAFINLPEAVAASRARGALKRVRGTPLSPVLFLTGRMVSALGVAIATGGLVLLVGVLAFDLRLSTVGLPLAVGVLVLGTASLSACGFALANAVSNSKAVGAVGLGVLLPLAFFSEVFTVSQAPDWMGSVGALFPLKHLAGSVSSALDPAGATVEWSGLLVMTAWLLGLGFVALRTFRWSR